MGVNIDAKQENRDWLKVKDRDVDSDDDPEFGPTNRMQKAAGTFRYAHPTVAKEREQARIRAQVARSSVVEQRDTEHAWHGYFAPGSEESGSGGGSADGESSTKWTAGGDNGRLGVPGSKNTYNDTFRAAVEKKLAETGITQQVIQDNMESWWRAHETLRLSDRHAAKNSEKWYYSAHDWTALQAEKFGVEQSTVAGTAAAISPMRKWNLPGNTDLKPASNRGGTVALLSLVKSDRPIYVSPEMAHDFNLKNASLIAKGDTLPMSELKDAKYISQRELTPLQLAVFSGVDGSEKKLGVINNANTNATVARAISIIRNDPSFSLSLRRDRVWGAEEPNKALVGPKVRSFFNNISFPEDNRFVTIDTWAYRNGLVSASGKETLVTYKGKTQSLAQWGKDGKTPQALFQDSPAGSKFTDNPKEKIGLYPVFSDAIRVNADKHHVSPSEYQAAIWIQIQGGEGGMRHERH